MKSILVIDTPKSCRECDYKINVGHRDMWRMPRNIHKTQKHNNKIKGVRYEKGIV